MVDADDPRPDPDVLLAQVRVDEPTRAHLKIFFGAAPGVGKTYAMLGSAHRLAADGVDVVVGVVETHGRAETAALLSGLEVVPRRVVTHRGVELTELDVDRVLARRPGLVLVDELAHTNAPGSRHVKRWQDVLDLLAAGIDVHATLNVQHIDSLTDVVQQITGIKVRETVPDHLLARADELELIDLPPAELLDRLAEGKVYLGEQAARAAEHFFHKGNLAALRELALRRTAERVDVDVQTYRRQRGVERPWASSERLLVGVGPSPSSERLLRAGARIALRLGAALEVAHVEQPSRPLGERDRARVEGHLRLAESLGAAVTRLRGEDVAAALLAHARARNVTRILAGKPTHGRWRDLVRGSLLDRLIRGSGEIELHVVAPIEVGAAVEAGPARAEPAPPPWSYATAVGGVAVTTLLGLGGSGYLNATDLAMMYLVAIMLAALGGRRPALVAAALAVAAFDFCFVPPRYTFAVEDVRHLVTFAVMFAAGLTISALTGRLRAHQADAQARERRTAALHAFTRDVAAADGEADVAAATVRHVEDMLGVSAAVLVPEREVGLVALAGLAPLAAQEGSVARWSFEHGQPAGRGTATLPGAAVTALPLSPGATPLGVLVIAGRRDSWTFDLDQRRLADALARGCGVAIGRARLAALARDATIRARTEELRSSLLSAVSHDLRTPLAVITGAATSLIDDGGALAAATRAELLDTIVAEARRLERVLQNLLGITRVETGLAPAWDWVPADELVGAALERTRDLVGARPVNLDLPADVSLPVDPVLFEQVLVNLIENACKYGQPPLELAARRRGAHVELVVRDHGPGFPPGSEERVFEKFFRAPGARATGVGLGLAICRGVVAAHGGTIVAETMPGGGGRIRIELPLPTDRPAPTLTAADPAAAAGAAS